MLDVKRQGQAATGAAVLLAVIAGLLIIFIILIPPEDRAELLGENQTNETSDDDDDLDTADVVEELLRESPGKVDFLGEDEIEHPLPVVNIFTRTESKILAEKNFASAQRGIFNEESSIFRFSVADISHTENILLGFTVDKIEGRLIINLNGEEIFDSEINSGSVEPIRLARNSLDEANELVFSVSSPGLAFWATNEVVLSDITIVADVTSTEAQFSKNIFLVSETEQRNLEKVVLKFQPDCIFQEVGKLTIRVNGNEIYSAVPDCELAFVPIEFSPDLVHQGENEIVFRTEQGSYLLSHVVVESDLKELEFPTYFFELTDSEYRDVLNGRRKVRLEMDFVDVITRKFGTLVINGHERGFDTKEVDFVLDISDDVVRENNAIKIKPDKTIEIREIRVDLVK